MMLVAALYEAVLASRWLFGLHAVALRVLTVGRSHPNDFNCQDTRGLAHELTVLSFYVTVCLLQPTC